MDNNIDFITSIEKYNDFEELTRRFVQKIFNSQAYITNGSYDGGKDLVYKIGERDVKKVVQISITKNNLEGKLNEDLAKTEKLVIQHSYPPTLIFFWNQKISESKLDKLKTNAEQDYGITLEFYDANRIAQKITHDYADLLKYLLEDIHKYKPVKIDALDIKEVAFYEYLTLSKEANNLKLVIVDSYIVSILTTGDKSEEVIIEETANLEIHPQTLRTRLHELRKANRIISDDNIYSLSPMEKNRIASLQLKENKKRSEAITLIKNTIDGRVSSDISESILLLIQEAYEASVNIQLDELSFESPKNRAVKDIVKKLERLLISSGVADLDMATSISIDLVAATGENEYLSDYCASRLCINLLNQKKLEQYIEQKHFFIYFDAPVLIPYLIALRYKTRVLNDRSIKTVHNLKEILYSVGNKNLRVTQEHFEETVRHLDNSIKISMFANDDLIDKIGLSKNVFFNAYLKLKKMHGHTYDFFMFLNDFIGYDISNINTNATLSRFDMLLRCVDKYLEINNIEVSSTTYYERDPLLEDVSRKYKHSIYKFKAKNARTIKNDVLTALLLSDEEVHCDGNGVGQTPILITWDASQHELRSIVRQKSKYKEWLIYSPQRAIERLSMIEMKISSSAIKDSVMALIDEDYFFKDSDANLIDTLALLIRDDDPDAGAIPTLLNKLSLRITEESLDSSDIEKESFNILNEVLLYIYHTYSKKFSAIRKLFMDNDKTDLLFEVLSETFKSSFNEQAQSVLKSKLDTLIENNN